MPPKQRHQGYCIRNHFADNTKKYQPRSRNFISQRSFYQTRRSFNCYRQTDNTQFDNED